MILVIDDDPRRIKGFRRALGKTLVAMDFLTATFHLSHYADQIATAYLDYDGVEGERIADGMARTGVCKSAKIIIHSSNYTGAIQMRDILSQAGYDVELKSFAEIVGDETD
jgi:hypothetical protein